MLGGHILQYFVPVAPVLVSWIISTIALYRSMNLASASEQGDLAKLVMMLIYSLQM